MKGKIHYLIIGFLFLIGIGVTILLLLNGIDYYTLPVEERFFSLKHTTLKPSGLIGHGIGILGSLMIIIGVISYMARKRFRSLFQFGYLSSWLEFHIFLCTVGPLLILFHTAFKFGGIVSVSFWSMVVVVLSGFVGRFIYIQIPRTIQGHELTAEELASSEADLNQIIDRELTVEGNLMLEFNSLTQHNEYIHFTIWKSLISLWSNYFLTRNILHKLKMDLIKAGISDKHKIKVILKIAKTKIALTRRIGTLRTMQKLFRYWHIFHLPFALSMFIIMAIHIIITITFGYKWIF
ncbi:MAG: hypothetical protein C0412_18660 [Flavobacterium sp.]|nr:hypothetical protein [Flavobacterium sp.]